MGQTIQITDSVQVDHVLLVSTDRSLTGQDGESFTGPVSAGAVKTFGGQVAARLFTNDPAIDHIYVMSNALSLRRRGGWDEAAAATALDTISSFFRFYRDDLVEEDTGRKGAGETPAGEGEPVEQASEDGEAGEEDTV